MTPADKRRQLRDLAWEVEAAQKLIAVLQPLLELHRSHADDLAAQIASQQALIQQCRQAAAEVGPT